MTTMQDLYPGGFSEAINAHEPYVQAVADALDANGFKTADWFADPNNPRDGNIQLDLTQQGSIDGKPIWSSDEVHVAWDEDRGWRILHVTDPQGRDSRWIAWLGLARVASPLSVVAAVAEGAGLNVELVGDDHPDVDFPEHDCQDDDEDIPFELALCHYRPASAPNPWAAPRG